MAETPQGRLIRYIQDAHAAEVGAVTVMNDFIKETDNPQVKALFQQHVVETQSQAQRLEARLTQLGSGTSDGKGLLNKMLGKGSDLLQSFHDEYDKTTQDLIKGYATENLEMGMYSSLASYAEAIGDTQTAQLALEILAEEKATAEKLFPMIAITAKAAVLNTTAA